MSKLDTLKKKIKQGQEAQKRIDDELTALSTREKELDAEIQAAAEAGAVDLYIDLKTAKENIDAEKYVKTTVRDKAVPAFDKDDVVDAWKEYAERHDKDLARMLEKYYKARRELYGQFMEIVRFQREALRERAEIGEIVAEGSNIIGDEDAKYYNLPLHHLESMVNGVRTWTVPELRFFKDTGDCIDADAEIMNAVIRFHKAI